jgi:hypothetical protein
VLLLDLLDPADPRADDGAGAVRVFFGEIDAAVLDRLDGPRDGELAEAVHPLGFPPVNVLRDVEVLDLAAEMHRIGSWCRTIRSWKPRCGLRTAQ